MSFVCPKRQRWGAARSDVPTAALFCPLFILEIEAVNTQTPSAIRCHPDVPVTVSKALWRDSAALTSPHTSAYPPLLAEGERVERGYRVTGAEGSSRKGAKDAKGPASSRAARGTMPGRGLRADSVLAEEQAAFLREVYDGIENFRDALGFLFTGFFRGYAHLEKHYGEDGAIERLEPVEQWFWVREGMFGEWEYNENAVSGRRRGIPIEREDFVVFETVALNRMLAMMYLRRNLCEKDWDSHLEVFGIPSTFLIGPPNASAAKEEEEYQRIAEEIISDGRGYLPNGSDIKYVTGGGGKPPFKERLEYLDRLVAMVGTGGLLTMMAQPGSGTLAGNAHTETFLQIARRDAAALSEVLQRDIDLPLLAEAFPGWPPLAYFEFAPAAGDGASKAVQDAAVLAGAGCV
jgi:hypothetical protein